MTPSVCVVGAGAAGAGAAHALRERDASVTVIERRSTVGGRVESRRRAGRRYEVGANYLSDDGDALSLLESLDDGDSAGSVPAEIGAPVEVDGPVWTFGRDGEIEPSDRRERKWTWAGGLSAPIGRLLERSGASIRTGVTVERLVAEGDGWIAVEDRTTRDGEADARRGPFDAVVLTPPAPATAELLAEAARGDERVATLRDAAESVPYRRVRSAILHYPFELERPWYALVNTDREHDVGWLAREERKPGHVPDGESLLLAQMSPRWSRERAGASRAEAVADAARAVATLLGDDRLRDPDWTDERSWRRALPDAGADREAVRDAEDAGLYVAGDWLVGEGRVHRALRTGVEAGDRVAERFAD